MEEKIWKRHIQKASMIFFALVLATPCGEGLTCSPPGMGMSLAKPASWDLSQEHKDPYVPSTFKEGLCCSSAPHRTETGLVVSAEARKPKKKFLRVMKGWGSFYLVQLESSNFHRHLLQSQVETDSEKLAVSICMSTRHSRHFFLV